LVQALAIINAFREEWPVLIVTPSTLRDTWADAAHQWLKVVERDMQVIWKEADILSAQRNRKPFVICSYDLIPKPKVKTVCVAEKWFKVVVCDESHYIKNHTVCPLAACAARWV
jgi:SWI/SNF-related matrix-associated actin-dependent regulator of chromatin subfamily A-like protein 1